MKSSSDVLNPFSVVAKALGCDRASLSIESAMYRDHGWDSFGHVSVITAIEEVCGIAISDAEMMEYTTMKAILGLFESHTR